MTKAKKEITSSRSPALLNLLLHTYNIIKENQGQVIAREFNFFFFFLHLVTLHLFGENITHSETYENCVLGQTQHEIII